MITLPIKKKWFDMILSGEKKEEYREIKPYYQSRFCYADIVLISNHTIKFVNGYGNDKPYFIAHCYCKIGTGKPEWGAEPGTKYYVLKIKKIFGKGNIKWQDQQVVINK